jgi:hypothetical protein
MATINDITKKTKSISDILVNQVVQRAPEKTGKLKRALRKANNVNTIFDIQGAYSKVVPLQSFEVSINYAPDDAPYGKFWNEPTLAKNIKNGNTKNIPESINFAEKAIYSRQFQNALDELLELIGETITTNIEAEI